MGYQYGQLAELADAPVLGTGAIVRKSSSLLLSTKFGDIAQQEEHLPYKQGVTGSSPVISTKYRGIVKLVRQRVLAPLRVSARS